MLSRVSVGITSDLHLGHKLASDLRGFSSVSDHDNHIIETLMQQCTKRTLLWILGDVAMSLDGLNMLKEIPCRKRLVRGNHDNFSLSDYSAVFEDVHGFLRYKKMWLSHCPIHPQEMHRVGMNVHGHIHDNAATKQIDGPYMCVNWDFWGRALSLDEVIRNRDKISKIIDGQEKTILATDNANQRRGNI